MTYNRFLVVAASICLIAAAGCEDRQARKPPPNLVIAAYKDGRMRVDGRAVTREMLHQIIESNHPNRRVSLYVEGGGRSLDPEMDRTILLVLQRSWVFYHTKPDFSDAPRQMGVPPQWRLGVENRTAGNITNLTVAWPRRRLQLPFVLRSRFSPVARHRVNLPWKGFVTSPIVVSYTTSDSVQHSVTTAIPASVSSAILDTNDMLLFIIREQERIEIRRN